MKKKVNGQVVEISNIATIELAFEGLAMRRLASSSIGTRLLGSSTADIDNMIKYYGEMHKALPFPLHGLEEDVKYAAIATYIQDKMDIPLRMWVDNGLNIMIGDGRALKFIGMTWGVVSVQDVPEDNTNIELYISSPCYSEMEWALTQLMNGERLSGYYDRFMGEFAKACKNEPIVLKWELSRLLEFGKVPKRIDIGDDKLIDTERAGVEYFLDIFCTGTEKSGSERKVIDLTGNEPKSYSKFIRTPVYDFEVYEKASYTTDDGMETPNVSKIKRTDLEGMAGVFQIVIGIGRVCGKVRPKYSGIVSKGTVVFQVEGTIYRCDAKKYKKPDIISRGMSIVGYDSGMVYMMREKETSSGVKEESTYAYDIATGKARLCRLRYL